jgi:hypothetical protein
MSLGRDTVGANARSPPPPQSLDDVGVFDALVVTLVGEATVAGELDAVIQDLILRCRPRVSGFG